jgi:exosortase
MHVQAQQRPDISTFTNIQSAPGSKLDRTFRAIAGRIEDVLSVTSHHRRSLRLAPIIRPHYIEPFVAALLLAVYFPLLKGIVLSWFNGGPGLVGVLVMATAAYMVWSMRNRLHTTPQRPTAWGLIPTAFAMALALAGTIESSSWTSGISLLLVIAGCVCTLYGFAILRELAYPLVLLLIMVPLPHTFVDRLVFQLQIWASQFAAALLDLLHYTVLRDGNILELVGEKVEVTPDCSGINLLVGLTFFTLVYSHFLVTHRWSRIILQASVIPIAIGFNAARIVLICMISQFSHEIAFGIVHGVLGVVTALLALASLVCMDSILTYLMMRRAEWPSNLTGHYPMRMKRLLGLRSHIS